MSAPIVTITLNPAVDHTVRVPALKVNQLNIARESRCGFGGKGINVARVLADLGCQPMVTGLMGQESASAFANYFEQSGIENRFVNVSGKTRENIKVADLDGGVTEINLPGFQATREDLTIVLEQLKSLPKSSFIAVCGSLPAGISIDDYGHFLAELKSKGFWLAVDNSGDALVAATDIGVDLIKPNQDELASLSGHESLDIEQALDTARELIHFKKTSSVVYSRGAEGAWFITQEKAIHARPGVVDVVSTVGAGDSMLAGCLYGHRNNYSLGETAKLATACGMQAVSQVGCGIVDRQQFKTMVSSVELKSIRL